MRRLVQPESDIDRNALNETQRGTARALRGISYSDAKNERSDAEKLARYARLDPELLHSVQHREPLQIFESVPESPMNVLSAHRRNGKLLRSNDSPAENEVEEQNGKQ